MKKEDLTRQIELAKQGDEQAIAGLIAWQMPRIRVLAARAAGPGLDYDDAVQEGIIGLFAAIEGYDPRQGAVFSTYAGVCIQNAVTSAVRAARRGKHTPLNTSVPISEQAQTAPGPEELVMQTERYDQTMRRIDTRLSVLEKQVLALFLDGCSYRVIARRLGIGEKAVDNAMQRARAKLR